MDDDRKKILAVLTAHEARIERWLRNKGIPACNVPDLRQEVYRRAIEYLAERELKSKLGGLLYKITVAVAGDYFEEAAIHARAVPKLVEDSITPSNPEQDLVERQLRGDLESIISTFDERCQAVLRLKFVEELSPEETAEALDVSLSTVKRQLAVALRACFAALQKKGHLAALVPLLADKLIETDALGLSRTPTTGDRAAAAASFPIQFPRPRPANRWQTIAFTFVGAVAGALVVYLLMRTATSLGHLPPLVVSIAAPAECTSPGGILDRDRPPTCPEAITAPPSSPSPPPSPTPASPQINARPRLLAQAAARALEKGDVEAARKFTSQLKGGAFADELAGQNPSERAP